MSDSETVRQSMLLFIVETFILEPKSTNSEFTELL